MLKRTHLAQLSLASAIFALVRSSARTVILFGIGPEGPRMAITVVNHYFGRCLRCMRKAFLFAAGAWLLAGVAIAVGDRPQSSVVTAVALGFTALWLVHICVFALRATKNRTAQSAVRAPNGSATLNLRVHHPSRRWLIIDFAATLALATAATVVPGARAQSVCGCRVGDICCNAHTQVTYQCETISGCTQWIETGNPCTPTQQNQC
jgi:hypothetical protein